MNSNQNALAALKLYWGYDSFRPLQERIVNSLLAGRDTCVVMPTGKQAIECACGAETLLGLRLLSPAARAHRQ